VKKALRGTAETVESVDARLEEIGRKLDRLRVLYESFFMGTERAPPNVPRRDLNRLILELQQVPIPNATLRFRFQTLQQRWVLLTTYWNRTLREIESGTYRRDLAKAHRHLAERGGAISEEEALRLGIPASRVKSFVSRQNKQAGAPAVSPAAAPAAAASPATAPPGAPRPAAAPSPPPPPAAPALPGLRSGELEDFYTRYAKAHQDATGAPPRATLEQMRAKLEQDLPRILAQQQCQRIKLDVAVEGGKVRLRAHPMK
jgi:hypothetical protein